MVKVDFYITKNNGATCIPFSVEKFERNKENLASTGYREAKLEEVELWLVKQGFEEEVEDVKKEVKKTKRKSKKEETPEIINEQESFGI